jgi:molybdate transport system substrate-binding protein
MSHFAGVNYVGPLPADIQKMTIFSIGIAAKGQQLGAAKALVKFLTAPNAAEAFKKRGMEPG